MRVSSRWLATLTAMGMGAAVLAVGPMALPAAAATPVATFGPPTRFATGAFPVAVALDDLNGDTAPDLATANRYGDSVSVLLGDGSGAFGPVAHFASGGGAISVAVGELNGDSLVDLAVANRNGALVGATTQVVTG